MDRSASSSEGVRSESGGGPASRAGAEEGAEAPPPLLAAAAGSSPRHHSPHVLLLAALAAAAAAAAATRLALPASTRACASLRNASMAPSDSPDDSSMARVVALPPSAAPGASSDAAYASTYLDRTPIATLRAAPSIPESARCFESLLPTARAA